MSEEEDKSKSASHKKRRLQNACDECKKRKTKCDSANMPGNCCSNCISLSVDCTHIMATIKKKRGPPVGKPRGSKSIRSIVSSILSNSKPFVVPDTPEAVHQLIVDLATHIRELEGELDELQQTLVTKTAEAELQKQHRSSPKPIPAFSFWNQSVLADENIEQDTQSLEGLSDHLKSLVIGQSFKRHFGTSSSLTLVKNAMDIKDEQIPLDVQCPSSGASRILKARRPEYWAIYPWQIPPRDHPVPLVFPEKNLMKKLIELYFVNFNQFLPVLHRPTFERFVTEGMQHRDRSFGYVLLAVCALGARYSDDPGVLEPEAPEFSAGWKYFTQINPIPSTFMTAPSLYQLQAICISIFFLQATSTPESVWYLVAVGIRLAQEVAAHRRRPSQKPTIEGELWKRVFWILYACDIYVSAFLGRPRATSSDDFDIDLPVECDDEYWETSDPELAFKQPPGRPSNLVYLVTFLRLLDILNIAQKTIYLTRRSETWTMLGVSDVDRNQRMVSELDSLLNNWIDTVPEHLKWDPNREDNDFFHQSVSLYVTYYWIQILVHKPFIPRLGSTSEVTFPSMTICANAARSACHVMEVQQRRGFLPLPNVLVTLYNSAIVLLLNAWRGRHLRATMNTNKELIDVYKCIGMIRSYETRWQSAGTYCDIIREIMSISNLYSPESCDPGRLKRYRDSNDESTQQQTPISSSSTTPGSSQPSSPPEPRKIAGTNRVTAATQSNSAQASAFTGMTLPRPFSTDVPPDTNFNINPIFSLPFRSTELGSLPLHESFDPFGDAQTFANSTDMWMNELFAEESQAANNVIPGPGPGFGQYDYSNSQVNGMQNQTYPQHTMMASLFSVMGPGPSAQYLAPEQTGPSVFADVSAGATSNVPTNMSSDWDSYISNVDDLLRTFMTQ